MQPRYTLIRMVVMHGLIILSAWLSLALFITAANADDEVGTHLNEQEVFQSGFDDVPQFGGPEGVASQLVENDRDRDSIYEFDALRPWFQWKSKTQDDHGVALGFFVSMLYQNASSSLSSQDDNALGNIFRFQGSWTALNNGGDNPGHLEWRIENRTDLGRYQSPRQLGDAIGASALNTGFAYSDDFTTDLSVLAWTQHFRNDRAGLTIGRLAYDVYLDAIAFQSVSRGFLNRSFILNPTVGATGVGALGFVSKGFVTDNIFVGAHIYDGNAVNGDFDWDTFNEHEFLKALEIGWAPSIERRQLEKIQFTYWGKDAREEAGVPSGRGWAVSGSWKLGESLLAFFRVGHSNGGAGVAAKNAVSGGFEYSVRNDQSWSFGIGWAEPTNKPADADNEYVIETSYAFQLAKNLSLLPDIQLIIDPANNPTKSEIWVIGLRAILML